MWPIWLTAYANESLRIPPFLRSLLFLSLRRIHWRGPEHPLQRILKNSINSRSLLGSPVIQASWTLRKRVNATPRSFAKPESCLAGAELSVRSKSLKRASQWPNGWATMRWHGVLLPKSSAPANRPTPWNKYFVIIPFLREISPSTIFSAA